MALSIANNSTGDYFQELFEPKISKTIFMAISVVLNLFCVALCFCVIWYERYGLDVKRTIMNQLFSKLCWTGIEFILFITLPEWLRFFYGPFPRLPCWLHLVIKNAIIAKLLFLQTGLIVIQYAWIFWLKNPFAFKDDFWCCFINIWSNIFSVWPHFAFVYLPGKHPVGYYICTGHDPLKDEEMTPKFNYIHYIIVYSSLVVHFLVSIRIFLHKKKIKENNLTLEQNNLNGTVFDKNSLSGFTIITVSLALMVFLGFIFSKYSSIEPKNYNIFPDYLIVYWIQLANAPLTMLLLLLICFAKNDLMRTVMLRETKEFLISLKET